MIRFFAIFIVLICSGLTASAEAQDIFPVTPEAAAAQIRREIASQSLGVEPALAAELRRVYEARDYRPFWQLDAAGEERARILRAAIAAAGRQGLDTRGLRQSEPAPAGGRDIKGVAERDIWFSEAYLWYASELRPGAAAATRLGSDWGIQPDPFDPVGSLLQADDPAAFATLIRGLEPPYPQYRRLVAALQHYSDIAAAGGWGRIPDDGEVKLDGSDARIGLLQTRLAVEGDLPRKPESSSIDDLLSAVRQFQERHGLESDGRVGRRTLAAMNLPAEARVQQIMANLQRWRFMPRQFGNRYIAVNTADASLELVENGAVTARMRTIVGDSRHPTPVMAAMINAVVLNPPWNVPHSIAVKEILPKLHRNPGYLAANDMVILERMNDDPHGLQIDWWQISAARFPFHFRQLPGPKNALGSIKFELPNRFDVYLHDTPVKAAFKRSERGLSHGCVRLEQPADLALRLLPPPLNNPGELAAALVSGRTQRAALDKPIPVYLLYWTAFVDDDGRVNFRNDLYGRDGIKEKPTISSDSNRPGLANPMRLASIGCPE